MNPLLDMLKEVKPRNPPILAGIVPENWLKEISRDSSFLSVINPKGMLPVKKLLDSESLVSFFRLAMDSGIGPRKLFFLRLMDVSSVRFPIAAAMKPS